MISRSGRASKLRAVIMVGLLLLGGSVCSLSNARAAGSVDAVRDPDAASIRIAFAGSLSKNRTATVYTNGLVSIRNGRTVLTRWMPPMLRRMLSAPLSQESRRRILAALSAPVPQRYQPATVNIVLRSGVSIASDVVRIDHSRLQSFAKTGGLAPGYSTDARTNDVLARLGVDQIERIARTVPRARLSALSMRVSSTTIKPVFDISRAYTLHLTNASVDDAIARLSALPTVVFAEPDWSVAPMDTGAVEVPPGLVKRAQEHGYSQMRWHIDVAGARTGGESLPSNYGIASSAESYLNAPGLDAVAAYDAIETRFGQLPGTGETITNVSVGDVCPNGSPDGSEAPTSHQIGGQNYLDVPSMPLIPEYSVDDDGNVSNTASVCGTDPTLSEILLDFSVMAPLPHAMQRTSALGSGLTDLLGIAPGAKYRLVVPQNTSPTTGSLVATMLAAASQSPHPDVITASLGYSLDQYGFPARYLEQDPVMQSAISLIVNDGIVVCIASGDGLREYTNAAVAPSGGSAALDVVDSSTQTTSLGDVADSTVPSNVVDSGAIAAGGSTTDDIFSYPPQNPQNAAFADTLAFPQTRWNGTQEFASGFGSRVDLSAPSDNIPVFELDNGGYDQVTPALNGGTSASSPMIAAAAAVALQVARLTGHPFSNPLAVRSFLEKTAVKLPNVPQADTTIAVGPQVDVEAIVEALAGKSGMLPARLPRVAVAQRQSGNFGTQACSNNGTPGYVANDDNEFSEATDPTNIVLDDTDACGDSSANNLNAYITLAPDWESIPRGATYRLYVTSQPRHIISHDRWVRLLPEQLFRAAGLPLTSTSSRTLSLTYEADAGAHRVASVTFALTFGPTAGTSQRALAPVVPAVVSTATIPVQYDFSSYPQALRAQPSIVVSYPGRTNPMTGPIFYPLWVSPRLNSARGTIDVPVSALQGDGIYGVAVRLDDAKLPNLAWRGRYSDFAMTRVATGSSIRPSAPLLSVAAGSGASAAPTPVPGHTLEIPFGGSFTVNYDVSSVPHASGAVLEISSDGPTFYNLENPFNNPNGSTVDANGHDSGSVFHETLAGSRGTVTLTADQAHLVPGMMHVVRVLPSNGSAIAGESSDVSSISEDGIVAPSGLALTSGYAIDPSGTDGIYTSIGEVVDGLTGGLDTATGFGAFSQTTGANESWTSNVGALGTIPQFTLAGGGYVANDTLVMSTTATQTTPQIYFSGTPPNLNPNPYPFWPLPLPPYSHVVEMGNNPVNQTSAFLVEQEIPNAQPMFFGLTANIAGQTSVGPIPLNQSSTGYPNSIAFDYDANANIGYALFASFPLVLASIDFATGSTAYTTLPYNGSANDFAIDSNTHTGAFTTVYYANNGGIGSGLAIVDLATAKIKKLVPISVNPLCGLIAVDPVNKVFAVQIAFPRADKTDNNPLSSVALVSEDGKVLSESPRLYNLGSAVLQNHWFGLNPATRKGFMFGPPTGLDFYQVVPFSY